VDSSIEAIKTVFRTRIIILEMKFLNLAGLQDQICGKDEKQTSESSDAAFYGQRIRSEESGFGVERLFL
jgi:hypothetical protein